MEWLLLFAGTDFLIIIINYAVISGLLLIVPGDDAIKHWGSIENFDMFIQKIKDDESEVAKLAIRQFGST